MIYKQTVMNQGLILRYIKYILPLIVGYLILYGFDYWFVNNNDQKVSSYQMKIAKLRNNLNKTNTIDLLKKLENLAIKYNIKIKKVLKNEDILVEFSSDYINSIKFLYKSERLSKLLQVKSLEFLNSKKNIDIKVVYSYGKKINIYNKQDDIDDINLNPFVFKRNKKFHLQAIVGDIVYINNKIFKLNDIVDDMKIVKITKNSVTLQNRFTKLVLRIYDE